MVGLLAANGRLYRTSKRKREAPRAKKVNNTCQPDEKFSIFERTQTNASMVASAPERTYVYLGSVHHHVGKRALHAFDELLRLDVDHDFIVPYEFLTIDRMNQ